MSKKNKNDIRVREALIDNHGHLTPFGKQMYRQVFPKIVSRSVKIMRFVFPPYRVPVSPEILIRCDLNGVEYEDCRKFIIGYRKKMTARWLESYEIGL
jgi:hypothetical protein